MLILEWHESKGPDNLSARGYHYRLPPDPNYQWAHNPRREEDYVSYLIRYF